MDVADALLGREDSYEKHLEISLIGSRLKTWKRLAAYSYFYSSREP